MADFAEASPTKRFFIDMLTRDIRLEDAILDLVDNAIDSVIRLHEINLTNLVTALNKDKHIEKVDHWVKIQIRDSCFLIKDNCGGIDIADARKYVFRFGSEEKPENSRLSVYGIGLKRAIFKIGKTIEVESKTKTSGFKVRIDVDDWETEPGPWRFPLEETPPAGKPEEVGTSIRISKLNPAASQRFQSGSFESRLVDAVSESYAFFLDRVVVVTMNDQKIPARPIAISNSSESKTSITKDSFENVDVTIIAGLQALDDGNWRGNTAGWYILCNGRVVVFADKSDLTGWGTRALPAFQPKHRGFIGVALFLSDDPEALPWTTTKRGINAEAPVFQYVRERMVADARSVISFLDKRYSSIPVSSENTSDLEVLDKSLADALRPAPLSQLFDDQPRRFSSSEKMAKRPKAVSVQFRALSQDMARARRAIGNPAMAAGKVGLHAFEYFLENEAEE